MSRTEFINAFNEVKQLNWTPSLRHGTTGIGYTLETLMGIQENNNDTPDLFGFEIKTHREMTSDSYVTLFTKAPNIPGRRANKLLLEKCGNINNNSPVLHASIFAHRNSLVYDKYCFQIVNTTNAIMLVIKDNNNNIILDNIGWSKTILQQSLEKKMKNLALISAEVKRINNIEFFKYTSCTLYYDISFNKFIDLIEQANIMIDIRLGTYRTGKNTGKLHDHGTAFRIKKQDIYHLYSNIEII